MKLLSVFMLLSLMSFYNVMAADTPITPGEAITKQPVLFMPPNQPAVDCWMTKPTGGNLSRKSDKNAYDGAYYAVFRKMEEAPKEPYIAEYAWKPGKKGRFALFVATTVQGVGYTSPIMFRVNDNALAPLPKPVDGTPQWGPSNAMAWTCMGIYDLPAGKTTTVHLQSDKLRPMGGYMSMFVNGLIAIDIDAPMQEVTISQIKFDQTQAKAGDKLTATLTANSNIAGSLRCVLTRRGETVLETSAKPQPNSRRQVQAQWDLPADLPTDTYNVSILPQMTQIIKVSDSASITIQGIDKPATVVNDLAVTSIAHVPGSNDLMLELNHAASTEQLIGLWLKNQQGHVIAALDIALVAGKSQLQVSIPAQPRWENHTGGKLIAFVHQSQNDKPAEVNMPVCGDAQQQLKPMASGILVNEDQTRHHWYVRDDHTLIWNGSPFVPVGGMYLPHTLFNFSNSAEVREKQWENYDKSLKLGMANGFNALYVNQGNRAPRWAIQSVVNDFNKRGLQFGWQLGFRKQASVYPIRSHTKQGLIKGQCDADGTLSIALPREKVEHVLLIGPTSNPKVHHLDLEMNLTSGQKPGFIQLDLTEDSESGSLTRVTLKRPDLPAGTYYGLAQVQRKDHFTNLWDQMDAFKEHYQWLKQIDWGNNLRLFIDPSGNEEGIYNQSDSVRVMSPGFEAWYANWLQKRYETLDKLTDAWSLKNQCISDWKQAARLLPVRDLDVDTFSKHIWWVDPQSGQVLTTTNDLGQSWDDYQLAMRISYASKRDELARIIKQYVNVPIVFKRVAPWVNEEAINTTPGGFDGMGLELYPAWGSVISIGLAAGVVEAQSASQTMWVVGTELGYNADIGNGKVKNWPSRSELDQLIQTTARFGCKGYFFFGWHLEPNSLWGNHNLEDTPEQMQWMTEGVAAASAKWPQKPMHFAQAYPKGHAWYFRVAGEPLTKDTAMYPGPNSMIKQSILLMTEPELWAVSSDVVMPDANPIIVNFQDAHAVARYGPQVDQWIKAGKHIIYVGLWPENAGDLCQLSSHFNNTVKKDDKGQYQLLRTSSADTVLAKDQQAMPWAKLSGRILIIARPIEFKANKDAVPPVINPQWVEQLLKR